MALMVNVKVKQILKKKCQFCGTVVKGVKQKQIDSYLINHQRSKLCKKVRQRLEELKTGVDNERTDTQRYS